MRTAVPWTEPGFVLRYHVGLEDPDDLIADLDDGFTRLQQAIEEHREEASPDRYGFLPS
jgi:hypothetical protein